MRKKNILLAITNGFWLIDEASIASYSPLISNLIKGEQSGLLSEEPQPCFYSVSADGAVLFTAADSAFTNAPVKSTAVLNIVGPIMKYDNCGDAGTATYGAILKNAIANPNIGSIVIKIDSPGGEVSGTEDFAKIIASSHKPIVAVAEDLMASAAYWFGSQAKELYASSLTTRIGSIGTMLSFADVQPYFEKQGVVFHEVYAPDSKDKNKDFAELRAGNYAKIKETLGAINDVFKSNVISGRGKKLNEKETLTGKVFMAEDAIKVGLIDGIKSMDDAIARAQELANTTENKNQTINNSNQLQMKLKSSLGAMVALLAASFAGFKAEETELSDEHLDKVNAELETMAALKTELETAKADALKVAADLATATASVQTLTAEKAGLQKEKETAETALADLKAANPGLTPAVKTVSEAVETETEWEKVAATLEHNKAVDSNPLFAKK
jgi:protease-4